MHHLFAPHQQPEAVLLLALKAHMLQLTRSSCCPTRWRHGPTGHKPLEQTTAQHAAPLRPLHVIPWLHTFMTEGVIARSKQPETFSGRLRIHAAGCLQQRPSPGAANN
jgi:hypothetical protein